MLKLLLVELYGDMNSPQLYVCSHVARSEAHLIKGLGPFAPTFCAHEDGHGESELACRCLIVAVVP